MVQEPGKFVFHTSRTRSTMFVVAPMWAFWFYALTGVLPRRHDTIETAWNRLNSRRLRHAVCFLAEWKARRAIHFQDNADAIRARLPVPDAADLEQAAACLFRDDAIQPWVATAVAKAIYERDMGKARSRRVSRALKRRPKPR